MLERLFKNKKYIFIYIMSILSGFCNFATSYSTFSSSLFASLVKNKIPVLVTFLVTSIIQGAVFGNVALIRYLLLSIIFAFFTSMQKKTIDDEKTKILKHVKCLGISIAISEIALLIFRVTPIEEIPHVLLNAVMVIAFSIIFDRALKYIDSIGKDKEEPIIALNTLAMVVMMICLTSCFSHFNFLGINLWHLICIIVIMLYSWKNKVVRAIVCALISVVAIGICKEITLSLSILILLVSLITCIISRAGRKGAIVGVAVCAVFVITFFFTDNGSSNVGLDTEIQQDYQKFLASNMEKLGSGEEYQKYKEEIEQLNKLNEIEKEAKNTISTQVTREMLIGFIILAAVPETYINMLKEHVDVDEEFKFIKEKLFKDSIIYRLNPGKEDEEDKKEEKPKTKRKTTKKKL